jgi:DNA (cytosine-5)-methyltransferase 1
MDGAVDRVATALLRASDYGVSQRRLRYFFLGRRDRRRRPPTMPPPTHRRAGELPTAGADLPETPTVADVLAKVPALGSGVDAEQLITATGEFLNMSTMRHSPEVIAKIAGIRVGDGPLSYRRLDRHEAQTVVAGHRALPVHPDLDRTVSVREAALIQGFPIDYLFFGPRARQPIQVANAVPPPVAEAIAQHLLSHTCQAPHTLGKSR